MLGALHERLQRRARRRWLAQARVRHAAIVQALARAGPPSRLLFLCLGNLCRSPFAAAAAQPRLPGIDVGSAGFLRHDGRRSPPGFAATAGALGVDVSACQARRVGAQQVAESGLIICMDLDNLAWLAREFPDALARTTLLGLFDPDGPPEVPDPFALDDADTRAVLLRMLAAIDRLVQALGTAGRPAAP